MGHPSVNPGSAATRRRDRFLALAATTTALALSSSVAFAYSGLDQRPLNSGPDACVAFAKPSAGGAKLEEITPGDSGFSFHWVQSPLDPNSWYIIDERNRIDLWTPGQTVWQARLIGDFASRVGDLSIGNGTQPGGSEEFGLVSFALHPQFASNPAKRLLYVAYTGRQSGAAYSTSFLSEFPFKADGTLDMAAERILLKVPQTASQWHHFDHITFGPDGFLYLANGDGGNADWSQDPGEIGHGKLLRIDVDTRAGSKPYGIPADNPFATDARFAPEVYAYGFRNPWRFSVDPENGEIWLGDVGQNNQEELNKVAKGGNYGWPIKEGGLCYRGPCGTTGLIDPTLDMSHAEAASVISGHIYHGTDPGLEWLRGQLVFGDWTTSTIYRLVQENGAYVRKPLATIPGGRTPNGFALDRDKNIYVVGMNGMQPGGFWRLQPDATATADTSTIPQLLSQTNCVNMANPTLPRYNTIPFNIAMPLWSDNSNKVRFLALPDGANITVDSTTLDIDYPVGTVLIKTFYYTAVGEPHETRLLMRYADGTWGGFSYVWRGADAELVPAQGVVEQVDTNQAGSKVRWAYPGRDACMRCHNTASGTVLGPEVMQLNNWIRYPSTGRTANQLDTWQAIGLFGNQLPAARQNLPALPWRDSRSDSSIRQARAYLHANCSHCHRPGGVPQASIDFRYRTPLRLGNYCNVAPTVPNGDLGIPGALLLTAGDPAMSIIPTRMRQRYYSPTSPELIHPQQMPPLATTWADSTALNLFIDPWIRRADVCTNGPDQDRDGVPDNSDNCTLDSNVAQYDFDGDGIGQACDADFDNNGTVDAADQQLLTAAMGSVRGDSRFVPAIDMNTDDVIDALDQDILTKLRNRSNEPGPSGIRPAL